MEKKREEHHDISSKSILSTSAAIISSYCHYRSFFLNPAFKKELQQSKYNVNNKMHVSRQSMFKFNLNGKEKSTIKTISIASSKMVNFLRLGLQLTICNFLFGRFYILLG